MATDDDTRKRETKSASLLDGPPQPVSVADTAAVPGGNSLSALAQAIEPFAARHAELRRALEPFAASQAELRQAIRAFADKWAELTRRISVTHWDEMLGTKAFELLTPPLLPLKLRDNSSGERRAAAARRRAAKKAPYGSLSKQLHAAEIKYAKELSGIKTQKDRATFLAKKVGASESLATKALRGKT